MRRKLIAIGLAAGVLGFGLAGPTLSALPQAPPPTIYGSGAISGVVTDGVTRLPVEGALVHLGTAEARGGPGARPRQRTDARGRFIFQRLPAYDMYGLQVSRHGYFDAGFRSAPAVVTSSRIALREGEWLAKADVTLWPPAAISGTVRDERGEPMVGVAVRSVMQVPVAGRARLATGAAVMTDDRGMYRLANLKPGRYFVHVPSVQITLPDGTAPIGGARFPAEPLTLLRSDDAGRSDGLSLLVGYFPTPLPGSGTTAYPMMYHPSARTLDEAEAVSVNYGDLRANVDVTLALVATVRISGQVVGPANAIAKLPVRLMPAGSDDLGQGAEAAMSLTDPLGRFTFLQVPGGNYIVVASSTQAEYATGSSIGRRLMPDLPGFMATSMSSGTVAGADGLRYNSRRLSQRGVTGRVPVTVGDQNIDDLSVPIETGVTVSGSFLWDGAQAPPADLRFAPFMRLEPADGDLSIGVPFGGTAPAAQGATLPTPTTFELSGVLPGRYTFGESFTSGSFTVAAVEYGGQDVMATPLVVTGAGDIRDLVVRMVSQRITLSGRVTASNGAVPQDAAVIIFPADRAMWRDYGITAARFKTASVTAAGTFPSPAGLLPGEYYAAAVRQEDRMRWTDAEFLNALASRATRVRLVAGSPTTIDLRFDEGGR